MTLETALILAYLLLASAVLAAMAVKRAFYSSPIFFAYICFDLGSTAIAFAIYHLLGVTEAYLGFFLFALAVDCLLCFCVFAELGKNLLRSNRESRPHWNLAVLLFATSSLMVSAVARLTAAPSGRSPLANLCFLEIRADGALEFAGFLALISWSSLRKLHWPERQLRIATGFGFATFAWFLISLLQSQWNSGPIYYGLYEAGQAAGLVTLAYWLHYFWTVDRGSLPRVEIAQFEGEDVER
jgi:hypothetical protein